MKNENARCLHQGPRPQGPGRCQHVPFNSHANTCQERRSSKTKANIWHRNEALAFGASIGAKQWTCSFTYFYTHTHTHAHNAHCNSATATLLIAKSVSAPLQNREFTKHISKLQHDPNASDSWAMGELVPNVENRAEWPVHGGSRACGVPWVMGRETRTLSRCCPAPSLAPGDL